VGALVAASGMLLAPMVQTFINAREATELMHESHLAMARISREFMTITNVVSGTSAGITYDTLDSGGSAHRRTLAWSGTPGAPLLLSGHTLMGSLQQFQLSYLDSVGATKQSSWGADSTIIEVVLDLGVQGSVYTNRFYPRNLRR
jgi:hypothetical protein